MPHLKEIIISEIKSKGPIPFDTFMSYALYYPELGYYTSPEITIGRYGDFYTSSHVHKAFGYCIGLQMYDFWRLLDMPEDFHIVEAGAGNGYTAYDIMSLIKEYDQTITTPHDKSFFDILTYHIVEISPYLKRQQQKNLQRFANKVHWHDNINFTSNLTGCIVSNELFDAMPVKLVVNQNGIKEVYIDFDGVDLVETLMAACSTVIDYFNEFNVDLPNNYRTEVNLAMKQWLQKASAILKEGFVLSFDYGYSAKELYRPERYTGTLMCYHKHKTTEKFLRDIGHQDITAHINFSALKKWGEENDLRPLGFCPQGSYLVSLGLEKVLKILNPNGSKPMQMLGIKNLILPEGFGQSHKVMVQYKGDKNINLQGFSFRNNLKYL